MGAFSEFIHDFIFGVSPIITAFLELIGIYIILHGSVKSFILLVKSGFNFHNRRITILLGETLSLALQFKMGAEIIKTVTIREVSELLILSIVVALRVILSLVLHWEVNQASKEEHQEARARQEKDLEEID